jgi:hypothetical protein
VNQHADPTAPKRVRVERNLWRRSKDDQLEAIYTGPDGKQHLKALGTKNVTDARKQLRAAARTG